MTDRELMQQALDALEWPKGKWPDLYKRTCNATIAALRERLAQPVQRADAFLFYAPGDVLICKESEERVVVKHGNTGPMQLANGKITLEWSGEVYGEYTLEQVMDGFIREGYAPRVEQPVQEPVACPYCHNSHTLGAVYFDQNCAGCVKRMTAPPRREWVGLTDEAIWLEYQRFWPFHPAEEPTLAKDIAKFARAIEAKLREKNGGGV